MCTVRWSGRVTVHISRRRVLHCLLPNEMEQRRRRRWSCKLACRARSCSHPVHAPHGMRFTTLNIIMPRAAATVCAHKTRRRACSSVCQQNIRSFLVCVCVLWPQYPQTNHQHFTPHACSECLSAHTHIHTAHTHRRTHCTRFALAICLLVFALVHAYMNTGARAQTVWLDHWNWSICVYKLLCEHLCMSMCVYVYAYVYALGWLALLFFLVFAVALGWRTPSAR